MKRKVIDLGIVLALFSVASAMIASGNRSLLGMSPVMTLIAFQLGRMRGEAEEMSRPLVDTQQTLPLR